MRDARRRPRGRLVACAALLLPAAVSFAQDAAEMRGSVKVEVTGSNIPRSEIESALPVQVITREDIARTGVTTTAELMSKVSANVLGFNDQLSVGNAGRPGLSSVNLRGIGDGSTLVLINGRRVANYAFDGGTVDVNSIPLTAVDRVEILKDGASAIYGTDAMAGVVNFILRKDYRGVEAAAYAAWTQHGGGDQWQAVVTAGVGDLAVDRYNLFVTAVYQKDDALAASARPFGRTGYIPAEGVSFLSSATFPANIVKPPATPSGRSTLLNPTYPTGCAPPLSIPLPGVPGQTCFFDYVAGIDIIPPAERASVYGRATYAINPDHQLFAEGNYANNSFTFKASPSPFPFAAYPAGGPFYPIEYAAANGISGDLNLQYRTLQLGPRTNQVDTDAWRALIGAEGTAGGWSYGGAIVYSESKQTDTYVSGYASRTRLDSALMSGLVNPFGASGAEGDALLADAQITGEIHGATGSTLLVDAKASKDLIALPGGPLAIALGTEARREKLDNQYAPVFNSGDIVGIAGDAQSVSGSREVWALFLEANVPLLKGLEAQLAVRYDHYSDFGGTTNPKIALRWQPLRSLLLRSSWGTGFRAPPLYDMYTPESHGFVGEVDDPIRCPVTDAEQDCGAFFPATFGGNPDLKPETSDQFNAGVVWEPLAGLSFGVDYWKLRKSGVIGTLDVPTLFADYDRYAPAHIVRGPEDPNYPGLPGPIESVVLLNENLGNLRTSGIDVDVRWKMPPTDIGRFTISLNGTYIINWEAQLDGTTYTSSLAQSGGVPRWKHWLTLAWEYGPWSATLGQTFQTGYQDANIDRNGNPLPVPPRSVGAYDVWDLQGTYTGFQNTSITLGVRNLMDKAPPFTNQPYAFQVGYDPNYADPRGRAFYVRLAYAFK